MTQQTTPRKDEKWLHARHGLMLVVSDPEMSGDGIPGVWAISLNRESPLPAAWPVAVMVSDLLERKKVADDR